MMKLTRGLLAAGALCAVGMIAVPAPAAAAPVTFSIQFGHVAIGYYDGYYDHDRRWHRWRNHHERVVFRRYHGDIYYNMRHDRDRDRYRRDWRRGRRDDWHHHYD